MVRLRVEKEEDAMSIRLGSTESCLELGFDIMTRRFHLLDCEVMHVKSKIHILY